MHVGLDGVHRLFDDQFHADRRREMEHHVAAIDELGEQRLVIDRVDEVFESRPSLEVGDVVDGAGGEIVEDQHLAAAIEQRLAKM